MSMVMHSDSTHWLAEAGQKTPQAMCRMSEAVKKQQLVLSWYGWHQK